MGHCRYCDEYLANNAEAENHAGKCFLMNADKTDLLNMYNQNKTFGKINEGLADTIDALRTENEQLRAIIERAQEIILELAGVDGEHHKQWTLDQALRVLAGDDYHKIIAEYQAGRDGPNTYYWDEGVAP